MIGTLLFLGTAAAAGALFSAAALATVRGRWHNARRFGLTACGAVGSYLLILLVVSALSQERVIPLRAPKKFCGSDCDIWLSVDDAQRIGERYIVRVKVQSDAARVTMKPSTITALLVDEQGRRYSGTDELDAGPLVRTVGPGESYTKTLVYHVPLDVHRPRVLLEEGSWITRIIIGEEGSFLHKKTLVDLPIQ